MLCFSLSGKQQQSLSASLPHLCPELASQIYEQKSSAQSSAKLQSIKKGEWKERDKEKNPITLVFIPTSQQSKSQKISHVIRG